MRRLEKAEGNISKLFLVLQRAGSREEFEAILKDTQEVIQDAKALFLKTHKRLSKMLKLLFNKSLWSRMNFKLK